MSVQITKQANFIKINVNENTSLKEYDSRIKEFNESFLSKKICFGVLYYDWDYNDANDEILNKIIYVFCSNNSYYTISSNKGIVYIGKRTIYDEKNPNINEFFCEPEDDISEFDKTFHVDDKVIIIDTIKREYTIANQKNGLFHGSTVCYIGFNSEYVKHSENSDRIAKRMLLNKSALLAIAQELIEEIKNIENIETILNLSTFEVVPGPDGKRLTNKKKDLY